MMCIENLIPAPSFVETPIAQRDKDYLVEDNPYLVELRKRYQAIEAIIHSQWTSGFTHSQIDLCYFRGDNAYIWQGRDNNTEKKYQATFDYLRRVDRHNLFDVLLEDGAFGVETFASKSGVRLSRDLLDSVNEITFLQTFLNILEQDNLTLMDIGAGYGRLAYRLSKVLKPSAKIFCVDAIPESTFLCDFYLKHRQVTQSVQTIALDDFVSSAAPKKVDIACNIHSFSECSLETVNWWLDKVQAMQCQYLFIVPNADWQEGKGLFTLETGIKHINYEDQLTSRGYRLMVKQAKYQSTEIQSNGVTPTYYYLYEKV